MKLYFLDGNEDWCYVARLLGWNAETVALLIEDTAQTVLFIPEYIPVSHIRQHVKNAHIVVVWRNYKLGVIENTEHYLNVVTDKKLLEKISNATYVPEGVHDVFSIMRSVSSSDSRTRIIESDSELENKTMIERAHMFKDTKVYKGKKFVREAYIAGCDISADEIPVVATRDSVAKHLNEYLNKLLIFLSINDSVSASV